MRDWLINDRADLAGFIAASGGGPHYVYLLRMPDGEPKFGGLGTPAKIDRSSRRQDFEVMTGQP